MVRIFPEACLQVDRGPQGYKVVEYIALRHRDLKEGRDGAYLIASVKLFQTLGPELRLSSFFLPYCRQVVTGHLSVVEQTGEHSENHRLTPSHWQLSGACENDPSDLRVSRCFSPDSLVSSTTYNWLVMI